LGQRARAIQAIAPHLCCAEWPRVLVLSACNGTSTQPPAQQSRRTCQQGCMQKKESDTHCCGLGAQKKTGHRTSPVVHLEQTGWPNCKGQLCQREEAGEEAGKERRPLLTFFFVRGDPPIASFQSRFQSRFLYRYIFGPRKRQKKKRQKRQKRLQQKFQNRCVDTSCLSSYIWSLG